MWCSAHSRCFWDWSSTCLTCSSLASTASPLPTRLSTPSTTPPKTLRFPQTDCSQMLSSFIRLSVCVFTRKMFTRLYLFVPAAKRGRLVWVVRSVPAYWAVFIWVCDCYPRRYRWAQSIAVCGSARTVSGTLTPPVAKLQPACLNWTTIVLVWLWNWGRLWVGCRWTRCPLFPSN